MKKLFGMSPKLQFMEIVSMVMESDSQGGAPDRPLTTHQSMIGWLPWGRTVIGQGS